MIDILCLSHLFSDFRPALEQAFPEGASEAQTFLKRVETPRNSLSHANGASLRQMEQILCYCNDVIDSLKAYYRARGMANTYDVPLILQLRDHLGRVWNRAEFSDNRSNMILRLADNPAYDLRPGDELALEAEVDPAFNAVPFRIEWFWPRATGHVLGKRLAVAIEESHISEDFAVSCRIITERVWHRLAFGADDFLLLQFKVIPS